MTMINRRNFNHKTFTGYYIIGRVLSFDGQVLKLKTNNTINTLFVQEDDYWEIDPKETWKIYYCISNKQAFMVAGYLIAEANTAEFNIKPSELII